MSSARRHVVNLTGRSIPGLSLLVVLVHLSAIQHGLGDSAPPAGSQSGGFDRYGGWRAVRSSATGFFRVEKIDGRWWFVTPEGNGFLSAGVNIHWCAFLENRTRKSGLKNYLDEPYEECVNRMREFNRNRLYATALGQ